MFDVCQIKHWHPSSPKGTFVSMSDQKLFNEKPVVALDTLLGKPEKTGKTLK